LIRFLTTTTIKKSEQDLYTRVSVLDISSPCQRKLLKESLEDQENPFEIVSDPILISPFKSTSLLKGSRRDSLKEEERSKSLNLCS